MNFYGSIAHPATLVNNKKGTVPFYGFSPICMNGDTNQQLGNVNPPRGDLVGQRGQGAEAAGPRSR
jgi:hypothetical protein